jgi:hypothetical protein
MAGADKRRILSATLAMTGIPCRLAMANWYVGMRSGNAPQSCGDPAPRPARENCIRTSIQGVSGSANHVAGKIAMSEKTVEIHRGRIMRKNARQIHGGFSSDLARCKADRTHPSRASSSTGLPK